MMTAAAAAAAAGAAAPGRAAAASVSCSSGRSLAVAAAAWPRQRPQHHQQQRRRRCRLTALALHGGSPSPGGGPATARRSRGEAVRVLRYPDGAVRIMRYPEPLATFEDEEDVGSSTSSGSSSDGFAGAWDVAGLWGAAAAGYKPGRAQPQQQQQQQQQHKHTTSAQTPARSSSPLPADQQQQQQQQQEPREQAPATSAAAVADAAFLEGLFAASYHPRAAAAGEGDAAQQQQQQQQLAGVRARYRLLDGCPWVAPRPVFMLALQEGGATAAAAAAADADGEGLVRGAYTLRAKVVTAGASDAIAQLLGKQRLAAALEVAELRDGVVVFEDAADADRFAGMLEEEGHSRVLVAEVDSHRAFRMARDVRALVVLLPAAAAGGALPAPYQLAAALKQGDGSGGGDGSEPL